jgi:cyclopropane fatty-acyl-phospholipid synthase-like methyltransferase
MPFESRRPFTPDRVRGYPDAVFDLIVGRFHLDGRSRLLDLGCGPGFLSISAGGSVRRVVSVSPATRR